MKITILDICFEYNGIMQTVNPVIIQDEVNMILIDTGYPNQIKLFERSAKQSGVDLDRLTHIIITHHDFDHVGSLAEFKRRCPDVKILASEIEKRHIEGDRKSLRLTQAEDIYLSLPDDEKENALTFHKILENIEKVKVDEIIDNHQILPIGKGIEVIFTPGHTEGHISLYIKEDKTLISGDALVLDKQQLEIPYPQFAYNYTTAKESVMNLFNYNIEQIICYHGGLFKGNWKEALKLDN